MDAEVSSDEDREKHSKRRKRNFIAKKMKENLRFREKVIDDRKTIYTRHDKHKPNYESQEDEL